MLRVSPEVEVHFIGKLVDVMTFSLPSIPELTSVVEEPKEQAAKVTQLVKLFFFILFFLVIKDCSLLQF